MPFDDKTTRQNAWEEVDVVPGNRSGTNLGWNRLEGDAIYDPNTPETASVRPVFVYPHTNGQCVVTGGYVYRGANIPRLRGDYVFGDFVLKLFNQ